MESRSEYLRRYNRERDAWLKEHHLCIKCKTEDAFTIRGNSLCAECSVKSKKRHARYYETHREGILARARINGRTLRENRSNNGLCTICGKPNNTQYKTCSSCRARKNAQRRARNHAKGTIPFEQRGQYGKCFQCITGNAVKGYKLCETCLSKIRKTAQASIEKRNNEFHAWREQDRELYRQYQRGLIDG